MSLWAFYGRVSGIEQAANNSIPTQREACHQRARERGADEVLDFIDAGVPGDLDWTDRPALNQLLDLVETGALQGVVVYDPDRLARDLGVQLAVTDMITKRQVHLEFITQQYDASPEGMLFYQLRGAISQFERAKIKERTNRGRKKLLREGIPANNPSPYGLRYRRQTNSWEVIEEQAETLRLIFGWASEGNGPSWIAQQLNARGIPSPRGGKRWWVHVVQRILANPAYRGTLHIHQWNTEGQRKNRFLPPEKRHKASRRPKDEWVDVPVPRIIDPSLWESAQEALGDNRRRWAGVEATHTYLASRLIRCGLCDSAMTAVSTKRGQRYYRCSGRYGERRLRCEMPHLRAAELDGAIWEEIRAWLIAPERYEKAVERSRGARKSTTQHFSEGVAQQLGSVRSDMARLQALIEKGALLEHEVRGALKNLREQEATLSAMLNAPTRPKMERFTAYDPAEVDNWDAVTRREHLRGVVARIVAFPEGKLEFYAREKTRLPERA